LAESAFNGQVAMALHKDGFENVRLLHGGCTAWKARGGMEAHARAGNTSRVLLQCRARPAAWCVPSRNAVPPALKACRWSAIRGFFAGPGPSSGAACVDAGEAPTATRRVSGHPSLMHIKSR